MENLKSLTSGEEQVMKIIWKLGPTYLKDIMLAFPEPKPHQNTVSTFLKNLVAKNFNFLLMLEIHSISTRIFQFLMQKQRMLQVG